MLLMSPKYALKAYNYAKYAITSNEKLKYAFYAITETLHFLSFCKKVMNPNFYRKIPKKNAIMQNAFLSGL